MAKEKHIANITIHVIDGFNPENDGLEIYIEQIIEPIEIHDFPSIWEGIEDEAFSSSDIVINGTQMLYNAKVVRWSEIYGEGIGETFYGIREIRIRPFD